MNSNPKIKTLPCAHEPKLHKGMCSSCYHKASRLARPLTEAQKQNNRARALAWAKKNPRRVNVKNKQWRKAHAGQVRKAVQSQRQSDPERFKRYRRTWRQKHPERARASDIAKKIRYDARLEGNGGDWTFREWLILKWQLGSRCVGCMRTETELAALGRKLVPDHIEPLALGGLNIIENLQPLCHGPGGCNNRKHARYMDFLIT